MISIKAICDRCGYEEKVSSSNIPVPERWETFGLPHKYLLCPTCSCNLKSKISDLIYIYVGNPDKRLLMRMVDKES